MSKKSGTEVARDVRRSPRKTHLCVSNVLIEGTIIMANKTDKSDLAALQSAREDYPPTKADWKGQQPQHVVDGSDSYENAPDAAGADQLEEVQSGPFGIPNDDPSGEGWTPPTHPGGGWVHPSDQALEERLEEVDEEPV